jgi:hypothetical protein
LKWIEIFVKRATNPLQLFLGNFYVALLVSNPAGLGTRSETSNILVLNCLNHVELSRIMTITFKPIVKLELGFGIMP